MNSKTELQELRARLRKLRAELRELKKQPPPPTAHETICAAFRAAVKPRPEDFERLSE